MSEKSDGCRYIVQERDTLTSWPEGRAMKFKDAAHVMEWLFEDVICRWGSIQNIVTDNLKVFIAAIREIEKKYGIKGIRILTSKW